MKTLAHLSPATAWRENQRRYHLRQVIHSLRSVAYHATKACQHTEPLTERCRLARLVAHVDEHIRQLLKKLDKEDNRAAL